MALRCQSGPGPHSKACSWWVLQSHRRGHHSSAGEPNFHKKTPMQWQRQWQSAKTKTKTMTKCKFKDRDLITRLLHADADPGAKPDSWFRKSSKAGLHSRSSQLSDSGLGFWVYHCVMRTDSSNLKTNPYWNSPNQPSAKTAFSPVGEVQRLGSLIKKSSQWSLSPSSSSLSSSAASSSPSSRSGSLNKRNSFLNLNKPTAASPALGKSPSKSFSKPEITYDRSELHLMLIMTVWK